MIGPVTKWHYAPNGNFDSSGDYLPGADGFNLADVSSPAEVNALPVGDKGLVWVGDSINGADASFQATINSFIGNQNVFGFYLADEPADGYATQLKAEADYIHQVDPGAKTFIVLENNGTGTNPQFSYNPANTDVDLFGLDPYPVQTQYNGPNYSIIGDSVNAAEAQGIPLADIVPVYQAFGGGGYSSWIVPTADQEQTILSTWAQYVPSPVFDYAYSWGVQSNDTAISSDPALQSVFAAHNAATSTAPTLTGQVVLTSAAEDVALASTTKVATFTDSSTTDIANNFTATINWGDGSTSTGTVTGSNGSFLVTAGHTYAEEGSGSINVTLAESTASALASGTVAVADSDTFTPTGATISATAGQAFTGAVAAFSDSDTTTPASDLTATINWGDGTSFTSGAVSGSNGSFSVTGTHTYAASGNDSVSVTLSEKAPGVATATANSKATVAAPPPPPPPAPTIASVLPHTISQGQSTEVATTAPGVAGDTLSLVETSSTEGSTLQLQLVSGVEEIIYNAPASVAVNETDNIAYQIKDTTNGTSATGSSSVSLIPPSPSAQPIDATMTATDRNGTTGSVPLITQGSSVARIGIGPVDQSVSGGVDALSFSKVTSEIVTLGMDPVNMTFSYPKALTVVGGSGMDVISANNGANSFTAGSGTLEVHGGSGADNYFFHAGDGLLKIEDFSKKNDTLTVDFSLKNSITAGSDGNGGTMLRVGTGSSGIDLLGVANFSTSSIHWS